MTDDEKRELIETALRLSLRFEAGHTPDSARRFARMLAPHVTARLANALEGTLTEPDAAGVLKAAQSEAARRTAHTLGERPEWVDGYRAGFVDGMQGRET